MSKQTAVEWLKDQIKDYDYSNNDGVYFFKIPFYMFQEKIEQALAMEREQMGLPNCKPIDEHIISVTLFDPATGKTYTRTNTPETYKGGEQ